MPHKMMNSQIADVLHDNRLSIEARMLYAYLCSFDDGAPPSTCQIIRQLGIGKTRFYRYRNELEAFGLIEVENTITSGGGVAKYSFPDEPVPTAEAEERHRMPMPRIGPVPDPRGNFPFSKKAGAD